MSALQDFVNSLGRTKAEVYNYLRTNRIKGFRKSLCDCPIANAVRRKFGYGELVTIGVSINQVVVIGNGSHTVARTTAACQDLLNAFDAGDFFDLDAEFLPHE